MSFTPGQRIESRCTRCKDIMGHVVIAIHNDEIAKVECCACGSVHKYYPPEKKKAAKVEKAVRVRAGAERSDVVKEKSVRPSRTTSATESITKSTTVTKARVKPKELNNEALQEKWRQYVLPQAHKARPYSLNVELSVNDIVEHSSFGIGIVCSLCPPDKAEILFEEGSKNLRCACR